MTGDIVAARSNAIGKMGRAGIRWVHHGFGLLLAIPLTASAQSRTPPRLLEDLRDRTPFERRSVQPDSVASSWFRRKHPCKTFAQPDSLALVSGSHAGPRIFLWAWEKGPMRIDWMTWHPSIYGLEGPDTLRAALVEMLCEPTVGASFLLERDGYFFGLDGSLLNALDWKLDDADSLGSIFVVRRDGRLDPAVFVQDLSPSSAEVGVLGLHDFRAQSTARAAEEARRRVSLIRAKGWSASTTKAVIDRKLSIGMTAEMVRMSWGEPESVNRTTTSGHIREQWVYGEGRYVYLLDGKVTAVQSQR